MTKCLDDHPCFNAHAHHTHERLHLPVAPRCNVQCNFCDRKYDCSNESRPGVTSRVLSPEQAQRYYREVKRQRENLSVVGIAGPGDPFANPEETLETLSLIREVSPDVMLCVASNGLNVSPYVEDLARCSVSHVTITMNAVDPEIISKVYRWGRYQKKVYRGLEMAELLLEKQLEAITALKSNGIIVKVNTIMMPGINDHTIEDVAHVAKQRGADLMNVMPLIPVESTPFGILKEPDAQDVTAARFKSSKHLMQMAHCARCRADAAGKIGEGVESSYEEVLQRELSLNQDEQRPYIAVASMEGSLVNLHLGEADALFVYAEKDGQLVLKELRKIPSKVAGENRWIKLAEEFSDCRAILVNAAGPSPKKALQDEGLPVMEMDGLIMEGLDCLFNDRPLPKKLKNSFKGCQTSCQGEGSGCA